MARARSLGTSASCNSYSNSSPICTKSEAVRRRGVSVATGVFGAVMDVALVNEGPVTLVLER